MTPQEQKVMEQALEALEKSDGFLYNWHENASDDEADAYSTVRQLNENAITTIKEVLAQQPQDVVRGLSQSNEQVEPEFKIMPREATREMLKAMDECSMEGYDERLYAGHAGSVYMAAWDAFAHPLVPTAQFKEHEKTDVRCECCGYMTYHREHLGCIRAARTEQNPQRSEDVNLSCKSTQARLATSWGYVKAEPLTDKQRKQMWHKANPAHRSWASFDWYSQGVADTEVAHGIKGNA